jgi:hypothetical protein
MRDVSRKAADAHDETCPICMEPLANGDAGDAVRLRCGHAFHASCVSALAHRCDAPARAAPPARRPTDGGKLPTRGLAGATHVAGA